MHCGTLQMQIGSGSKGLVYVGNPAAGRELVLLVEAPATAGEGDGRPQGGMAAARFVGPWHAAREQAAAAKIAGQAPTTAPDEAPGVVRHSEREGLLVAAAADAYRGGQDRFVTPSYGGKSIATWCARSMFGSAASAGRGGLEKWVDDAARDKVDRAYAAAGGGGGGPARDLRSLAVTLLVAMESFNPRPVSVFVTVATSQLEVEQIVREWRGAIEHSPLLQGACHSFASYQPTSLLEEQVQRWEEEGPPRDDAAKKKAAQFLVAIFEYKVYVGEAWQQAKGVSLAGGRRDALESLAFSGEALARMDRECGRAGHCAKRVCRAARGMHRAVELSEAAAATLEAGAKNERASKFAQGEYGQTLPLQDAAGDLERAWAKFASVVDGPHREMQRVLPGMQQKVERAIAGQLVEGVAAQNALAGNALLERSVRALLGEQLNCAGLAVGELRTTVLLGWAHRMEPLASSARLARLEEGVLWENKTGAPALLELLPTGRSRGAMSLLM